ncbi:protease [Asanoa iriomotensis]|uniref:Protease n=1 Tax=Asanoa iriomotensis TaxID=234613 RepID=A0ABQ4CF40_9ACTN|nr:protease [Asanoa iriomotensis]
MKRARSSLLGACLTVGLLLALPGQAIALAVTPEPAPAAAADRWPDALVRDYLKAYPHLTAAQVRERLDRLAGRKSLAAKWQEQLSGTYAGTWYDFGADVWHIQVTKDDASPAVAEQAAAIGQRAAVDVVRHALTELDATRQALQARLGSRTGSPTGLVHVDVQANRVVAEVDATAARSLAAADLPDHVELRAAKAPTETVVPAVCHDRYNCGQPLRGGINVGPWNTATGRANNYCSLGFTVRASDSTRWALTAGHCASLNQLWGHGEQQIGQVRDVRNNNTDAVDVARIRIANAYWLQAGGGYMYSTSSSTVDVDAAITNRSQIEINDPVCFNSRSYPANPPGGDNCGVVILISSLYRTMPAVSGVDMCGGDSGGSAYLKVGDARWAYGLVSATTARGTDDCMRQGSVYFSPLPDIYRYFDQSAAATIRVETR